MRVFLAFFLLLTCSLQADTEPSFYLTSENDTLSLLDGVVNVSTGKLVQIEKDIQFFGENPFEMTRYYDSGHHFPCEYGYGVGLSVPTLLTFNTFKKFDNVYVEQRAGSELIFSVSKVKNGGKLTFSGTVAENYYKYGYTNCCEALLRGEPSIHAMKMEMINHEFIWTLGDGTKRKYHAFRAEGVLIYYRLYLEELPNGTLRHYNYISGDSIYSKQVFTTDSATKLVHNCIDFTYTGNEKVTLDANNGQSVTYEITKLKGKAKKSTLFSTTTTKFKEYILTKVTGTHFPTTELEPKKHTHYADTLFSLEKITRPDGRTLSVEYDDSERVTKLYESGNLVYTFDYHKDYTIVKDAKGNVKRYDFEKKRRLVKLTEPHKTTSYTWDKKGQLIKQTVADAAGLKFVERHYIYDERGNIVETKIIAPITKVGSNDEYIVRYTYSNDGRNNLLRENHNNEREICYYYLPNSSLLQSKTTYADQMFVEKEYYTYDNNAILIKKVTEDGSFNSFRKITEYEPQLSFQEGGITLPKIITESYQDIATGENHSLQKTERIYTKAGLVSQEFIYDSSNTISQSTQYNYNNYGQVIHEINQLGDETTYEYDANGNKISEYLSKSGLKTTYEYDSRNRLVKENQKIIGENTLSTTHTYDSLGNRTSTTDIFNGKTSYIYDSASRQIAITDPYGSTERFVYDVEGRVLQNTDKNGFVTKKILNLYGSPLKEIFPDGTFKEYVYNLQGHLTLLKERDGSFKKYDPDYLGRNRSIESYSSQFELLSKETSLFNGAGIIEKIDPAGYLTQYEYDGAGRIIRKIEDNHITQFEYDTFGRLWKTIYEDSIEFIEYDFLNRIIEERIEDHTGQIFKKTNYSYDVKGNRILERVYSDSQQYHDNLISYNCFNEPILITDPEGNTTTIKYVYGNGLTKTTVNALGQKKVELFDKLLRLQQIENFSPLGLKVSSTKFVYNPVGLKIKQIEEIISDGEVLGSYSISTNYNCMREKISETEQDNRTTSYDYEFGRLIKITKSDNVTLSHRYDDLGCLTELISSDGSIDYRYEYDANNNMIAAHDLVNHTTTRREYDRYGDIIYEQQASGIEFNFSYDLHGRLVQVNFLDTRLSYLYNPTTMLEASRYQNNQFVYSYTQKADWRNKVKESTLPNGLKVLIDRDLNGRCSKIHSSLYNQTLCYDAIGNLIQNDVEDQIGTYQQEFTYDSLNQITSESGFFSNEYCFDSINNRRQKNENVCLIDPLNQISNDGNAEYTYDLTGRRTAKNNERYEYDALGRLLRWNSTGKEIEFKYDPFGRVIERNDSSGKNTFFHLFETEIGKMQDGKVIEFRAIHSQHAPFGIEIDNVIYSPIRNHRGDICLLADGFQNSISTYRYDVFGLVYQEGNIDSPWLFSGQRYDKTIEIYYFAKRAYDPAIGRWLTPDPLGFVDGPNLYAYVHNNPLTHIDPYGLASEEPERLSENRDSFWHSFAHGAAEDASWGLSKKIVGRHQPETTREYVGYYSGTAFSMGVGMLNGSTEIKAAYYTLKCLVKMGKYIQSGYKCLNAGRKIQRFKNAKETVNKTREVSKKVLGEIAEKENKKQIPLQGEKQRDTIQVTPQGVAIPNGEKYKIPEHYVENVHRSGSYGEYVNGKFVERLRIDPATPKNMKGPNYSHYHVDGKATHYSPRPGEPNPGFAK